MKKNKALYLALLILIVGAAQALRVVDKNVESPLNPVDALFIGDSITYGWNFCPEIINSYFGDSVAIQGISGIDTLDLNTILLPTKNYRSRLSIPWWKISEAAGEQFANMHFALKGYAPRVVVLEIGVNNWARTVIGKNERQIENYKALRNYKGLKLDEIQEDAAVGSINNRGVYQILWQIKERYGEETSIVVVGAFPTYSAPDPVQFNTFLNGFTKDNDDPVLANVYYLDPAPIAHIAWSEEHGMYYDHDNFPEQKEQFDSIHVDWGHLNEKGYEIYAKMLECPVKQLLEARDPLSCSSIRAADMNRSLK